MNLYFVRTAGFLNNFSSQCEAKMEKIALRLKKMDTAITLLETKVLINKIRCKYTLCLIFFV